MTLQPVGIHLRQWRQRRRLSQLDLAVGADISARHLSFVETGRSQPSRDMVLLLAQVLEVPLRSRNELLNELWVNDRSTTAYASDSVEKLLELGDPTLEQVATPAAAGQQRHRLRHLHVRRKEQDRGLRKFLADQVRGLEALRPMIRRHADVDDGQIRSVLLNEPDQLRPVAGLADDLVPALLEQAREALAHQHVIVGDDDSRAARIDFGHGESIPQQTPRSQAEPAG